MQNLYFTMNYIHMYYMDVHVCNCKESGKDARLQRAGLICLCRKFG